MAPSASSTDSPADIPVSPNGYEFMPETPQHSPLDSVTLVALIIVAGLLFLFIMYMAMKVGKLIGTDPNAIRKPAVPKSSCCGKRAKNPKAILPRGSAPLGPPPPWALAYKAYQESPTDSEAFTSTSTEESYPRGLGIFVEETDSKNGKNSTIRRSDILADIPGGTISSGERHV